MVLSEALKAHAGITETVAFVGLGHKFQIWEPERFRAQLAEATEKVRALKAGSAPGWRRETRKEHGNDGGRGTGHGVAGGPAPHIPVLARPALDLSRPARRRRLRRRHVRRRRHTRLILGAADAA